MMKTRVRQQRKKPQRHRQRRQRSTDWQRVIRVGLLAALMLGVGITILWAGAFSYHHPVMGLRRVAIPRHLPDDKKRQIAGKVKPYMGQSLLLMRISRIKREIETLPWVKQAKIKRHDTHRLDIALDTQTAFAYWQGHGVLNDDLEVFTEHMMSSKRLVHIDAPRARLDDAAQQIRLISRDQNSGLVAQKLQWQSTGIWRLRFKNGLWAVMDGAHYVNELGRLLLSYTGLMSDKNPADYYVDTRYPHGLAIGRQNLDDSDN